MGQRSNGGKASHVRAIEIAPQLSVCFHVAALWLEPFSAPAFVSPTALFFAAALPFLPITRVVYAFLLRTYPKRLMPAKNIFAR